MPGDLTTALGALLADARLRAEFRRAPAACAERLGLTGEDGHAFQALDPDQLDEQGEALVAKRLQEAARLAPETFARLGESGAELFAAYAPTHWPRGHLRHVHDALAFLLFLLAADDSRVSRPELNRLRFALAGRRLALHLVALRDPFSGHELGRRRPALQLLVCVRGEPREHLFAPVWPWKPRPDS